MIRVDYGTGLARKWGEDRGTCGPCDSDRSTDQGGSMARGTYRNCAVAGSSDFMIDSPGRAGLGSPDDLVSVGYD